MGVVAFLAEGCGREVTFLIATGLYLVLYTELACESMNVVILISYGYNDPRGDRS
jgi:hypothetical protein